MSPVLIVIAVILLVPVLVSALAYSRGKVPIQSTEVRSEYKIHSLILYLHIGGVVVIYFLLATAVTAQKNEDGLGFMVFSGLAVASAAGFIVSYSRCKRMKVCIQKDSVAYFDGKKKHLAAFTEVERVSTVSGYIFVHLKTGNLIKIPMVFSGSTSLFGELRSLVR
jgi:hypothetical protein